MEVYYRGERIEFTEIPQPVQKPCPPQAPAARAVVVTMPKKDYPWQQSYKNMKPWRTNGGIASPVVWNTSFRFALKNRARSRTHSNDNKPRK